MKLLFPNGEHAQVELKQGVTRVGSAPDCQIVLAGIGLHHCELQLRGDVLSVQVHHPEHVVSINGQPVRDQATIKPGDALQLGQVRVRVVAVDRAPAAAVVQHKRDAEEDDGRTKIRAALPRFMLRGVSGVTFGRVFPIHGATVIGRQADCDLVIQTEEVSRRHCELRPTADGLMVEDLGSANGTYINDRRITREFMRPGDELRLDTIRFHLVAPGMEPGLQARSNPAAAVPAGAPSAGPATAGRKSSMIVAVWVMVGLAAAAVTLVALKVFGVF